MLEYLSDRNRPAHVGAGLNKKGADTSSRLPNPRSEDTQMITVTPVATTKVKEIMSQQNPSPVALRVAVVGGGCSGFSYHMAFENQENPTDNVYEFDGLKVLVDQMSEMYLDVISIDYIETLEGAGFKFNNPNVKSTCGCGSSFSVYEPSAFRVPANQDFPRPRARLRR